MLNPGKIYIIATPIGNLEDITLRAIRVLKEVQIVFAEDTRVTKKLLSHLGVKKPIERFDENISDARIQKLLLLVSGSNDVALVTDAGTPNLSDPGWRLVQTAIAQGIEIIPVPGPSALTTIISISHFPMSEFVFLGFPPHKKGRGKFFESVANEARPVILYESPHRISKTINELSEKMPEREVMVAKELTKIFERVWRGKAKEVGEGFKSLTQKELKGEFVIVISSLKH